MKIRKVTIISSIFLCFLLMVTGIIAYKFVGPGAKDIGACRSFINKLYSISAIDTKENINDIKYNRQKKSTNENDLVSKSIVTQNYALDLDKNDNIIGFIKKDIQKTGVINIEVEEAEKLSVKYLKSIYGENIVLKSIQINDKDNYLPYYSFIYTKHKDGYPFYFDEIKLNIDKENGLLDGYSNSTMQLECKEPNIKISFAEAEKMAVEFFMKYNKEGIIQSTTTLVYADRKNEKDDSLVAELCYMVVVNGKDINGNSIKWKIFVSSENGDIITSLKDGTENKVKSE